MVVALALALFLAAPSVVLLAWAYGLAQEIK
jgi:hypothetical protein